jgi:2-octaprenyl-6-methoxyphenol hydroxylase
VTGETVAIVGAGPVGAVAALALAERGVRVRLFEARARAAGKDDRRALALSWGSRLALERMGLWARLGRADPIDRVSVSERGAFGSMEFSRDDLGTAALGYVVDYGDLARACAAALDERGIQVDYRCNVARLDASRERVRLVVHEGDDDRGTPASVALRLEHEVAAACVILADGAEGIEAEATLRRHHHPYRQVALVGEAGCEHFTRARAFERFTGSGPLALLPRQDRYACVWVLEPARARSLLDAGADALARALEAAAGPGFGRMHWIDLPREVPLALRRTEVIGNVRVVPIGNAAQMLHPVAGQGFNLGVRDALALASAWPRHDDGLHAALSRYRSGRRADRMLTVAVTDLVARITAIDDPLAAGIRGLGIAAIDLLPPLRRRALETLVFGVG